MIRAKKSSDRARDLTPRPYVRLLAGGIVSALVAALMVPESSGAGARRDPRSPKLRPAPADVRHAVTLLLSRSQLPPGFHTFSTGASPANNVGQCHSIADPDLSALTETAEVYGAGLANTESGVLYMPSAFVFVSAAQARRAQDLETTPEDYGCAVVIAKERLQTVGAKVTSYAYAHLVRHDDGVEITARQAILSAKVARYTFRVETSLIFLRRGRGLCEIVTSGPWNLATRRTRQDAISAEIARLRSSGF